MTTQLGLLALLGMQFKENTRLGAAMAQVTKMLHVLLIVVNTFTAEQESI